MCIDHVISQHGLIALDWLWAVKEPQRGGLVVNKGTLRVNCPASEWPLPLVHSNEQERVIIFLFKVNPPLHFIQTGMSFTAKHEVHGVKMKFNQTCTVVDEQVVQNLHHGRGRILQICWVELGTEMISLLVHSFTSDHGQHHSINTNWYMFGLLFESC